MGLETNLEKTKYLVCTHRYIWGKWSEAAYKRRSTGEGATFRERKQVRVSCTLCRVTVAALSLKGHMLRQHGRSPPQIREVQIWGEGYNYLCGFLPPVTEDGEMPSSGLSGSSA